MSIVVRGGLSGTLADVNSSNELLVAFGSTPTVSGVVSVSNFPSTQAVSGVVSVTNFPSVQPVSGSVSVSGTVSVGNFPSTQSVSGTVAVSSLPALSAGSAAIGSVSVSNFPSTQAVTGAFFQATQPISAASLPLPSGAATAAGLTTINTTLGSPFQVGGSIGNTTFASTQSGVWNVTNISGTVSLPTGASTSALQTTINTSLGTIDTDLKASQPRKMQDGAGNNLASSTTNPVGTEQALITRNIPSGTQPISAASLPLPSGAAQDGTDSTGVTQLTGGVGLRGWTSGIFSKVSSLVGTAGTSSTNVLTIQGIASGTAVPVSASGLPLPTGAATSANQTLELAQLTTIATNTGAQATDTLVNGTITAVSGVNSNVLVNAQGAYTVTVAISGTWAATLVFQGQLADNSWVNLPAAIIATVLPWQSVASTTSNNNFVITCGGFQNVRVQATAFTSGTVNVGLDASLSQMTVIPVAPQAYNYRYINTNGTITLKTGAGRLHMIASSTTTAGTVTVFDNTSGSGNTITVFVGGTPPTNTGPIDCAFNTGLTVVVAGGWQGSIYYI